MIRVVVDTNVLVSAIRHGTTTRRLAERWMEGGVRLLVSREIVAEYIRVLAYPRLRLDSGEVKEIMEHVVLPYAEVVRSASRIPMLPIEADDVKFVVCAAAGNADYIVTGDKLLLKLNRFKTVRVVTPAYLLGIL